MAQHYESQLQQACVKWFKLQYKDRIIFAIPNGGKRNIVEAAIMKNEGVLAGVPDLFIPEPYNGFHGMFIEMKYGKNKLTDHQKKIMPLLQDRGYNCEVCYSIDEFIDAVNCYFKEE